MLAKQKYLHNPQWWSTARSLHLEIILHRRTFHLRGNVRLMQHAGVAGGFAKCFCHVWVSVLQILQVPPLSKHMPVVGFAPRCECVCTLQWTGILSRVYSCLTPSVTRTGTMEAWHQCLGKEPWLNRLVPSFSSICLFHLINFHLTHYTTKVS